MVRLSLSLLGPFSGTLDGQPIPSPGTNKVRALLAYLAVEADRPHHREVLAGFLWPDYASRAARDSLRNALAVLRKVTGDRGADDDRPAPLHLLIDRETVQFNRASDYWLDVEAFGTLAAAERGDRSATRQWEEAIALYRGSFLEGLSLRDSAPFEDWSLLTRERLQRQALAVLDRLVKRFEHHGDHERACEHAWRQVELEPWQEEAHRQLMRLLALDGQRSVALAQYETCRRLLAEELDVEPSEETVKLYACIRDGKLVTPRQGKREQYAALSDIDSTAVLSVSERSHELPPSLQHTGSQKSPRGPVQDQRTGPCLGPAPLEGERRLVTAVLADIRGSAELLESVGTEAWAETLNNMLQLLRTQVYRYGGEIVRLGGDQLVACFGATTAHEDDPERAVLALLAMQKAFQERVGELSERERTALRLWTVANTGEAIVATRDEGHQHSRDMAIGEATVLTHRIRETIPLGSVLVSENTYRLVQPLFEWASPQEIAIEGVSEPLAVYRPLARRTLRGKGRGITGISSPLVGRQAEFRVLQDAVTRLRDGIGGMVTLVGEAGIGKSRLVAEVRRPATLQWVEGRCLSYRTSVAYDLWLAMLRELLGGTPNASPVELCDALAAHIQAFCPEQFGAVYPCFARLMSLPLTPDQEAMLRGLDAESLKAMTSRAMETLVESMARQGPLVVACEDLQWADPTSIALLERLMPLTDHVPLLLLCVFRPERASSCWRVKETAARLYPHRHIDLWLDPLSESDSETLVDNLLCGDVAGGSRVASPQLRSRQGAEGTRGESAEGLPHELQAHVLMRAEGNPLYVEEIIRSLIDGGVIVYDETRHCWSAVRDVTEVAVPDTLHGTLMSRIDRLPELARRVLQLASVLGRIFSYRVLAAITEAGALSKHAGEPVAAHGPGVARIQPCRARAPDDCLAILQREQMIRERARMPEREFIFQHQLTLEATYSTLLTRERCCYHRAAAEVIERLYPDRVEEQLGLLAYHWERAGETEQAVTYVRRAGGRAAAQFANEEAESYFTRALELTPEGSLAERYALLLPREEMYDLLGEREAQRGDLALLKELAEALGDSGRQARVALRGAHYAIRTCDYPAAVATAQAAIRLAQAAQDVASEAAGYREWGRALFYRQEYGLAQQKLDRALVLARGAGLRSVETDCLQNLGATFLILGDYTRANTYFSEKLHISRKTGDRISEGVALRGLGMAAGDMGEYAEARAYLEQSLRVCRETGNRRDEGWALLGLGDLSWAVGDYDQAKTYHEQAVGVFRATRDHSGESRSLLILGDVARIESDYAEASAHFERSLQVSREIGVPIVTGFALTGLGLVSSGLGELAAAKSYLEQAVALWRELGYPVAAPLARLAQVYLLQGQLSQAQMCVDEVLSHLENDPALSGSREAPEAYLACHRVLSAQGDARAGSTLSVAHRLLLEHVAKINDEELQRSFLENVAAHRQILAAWQEAQSSDH